MTAYNWSTPPAALSLKENEIHVWRAYLESEHAVVRSWESQLAPDELDRAARFVFRRDRDRFIVRRGILRTIIGQYIRRAPSDVRFVYGRQGKPKLLLIHSEPPICFNVSHSQGLAVYAIACDREI